jgi:hypothetical protein
MSKLQSDIRRYIAPGCLSVGFKQCGSQVRQAGKSVRCNYKLIRICPAFVGHGYCLSSPNEARPAVPKSPPTAQRIFARATVWKCVPTLHRLDRDPIAELESTAVQRPPQGRLRPRDQFAITWDVQSEGMCMVFELFNVLDCAES